MPASFPTLLLEKTTAGLRERERPHEGVRCKPSARTRGGLWRRLTLAFALVAAVTAALAPGASAVVTVTSHGQFIGVMPRPGVNPAMLPGVKHARTLSATASVSDGLGYHGGPVLHTTRPYLVFWVGAGGSTPIDPGVESVFDQYLTDTATTGATDTDGYGVGRQYTDTTGFADAGQSFSAASQSISDTQPYPTLDTNACASTLSNCVTDAQVQAELTRLIAADGLPTGTGARAPVYFVVLPDTVDGCDTGSADCASSTFCAYHSNFTDGPDHVAYAVIPLLNANGICQADGTNVLQAPNGTFGDVSPDVGLDNLSHEYNESITDPLGTGWWSASTGQEEADNCESYGATEDPANGLNPDSYLPTLGGTEDLGTLYDQLIDNDQYYTQTEWSNGDLDCHAQPVASGFTPGMLAPAAVGTGTAASFTPSAGAASVSSATWDFGDGSPPVFTVGGGTRSHTYVAPGRYTVTLTVVDDNGNLATKTHPISVGSPPTAAFTAPSTSAAGATVDFDASGSSDPNAGVAITGYSWRFGDGSSGTGVAPTHAYAHAGTYDATLTIADSGGFTASAARTIVVHSVPAARIAVLSAHPAAGVPVGFSAASSTAFGGSLTGERWSFGDGTSGAGTSSRHTFTRAGTYRVRLTVTTADAQVATAAATVTVAPAEKITRLTLTAHGNGVRLTIALSGPGALTVAGRRSAIRSAGTHTINLALSAAQKRTLRRRHALLDTVKVTFAPSLGPVITRTVKVTLRRR